MNAKKLVCIVLALLMCLPVLASCNQGPQILQPGKANANLDTQYPNADYQGEEFTFLVIKHTDQIKDYYGGPFIDAEKLTGDKISDAVFNRNSKVEEKYNVVVNQKEEVGKNPSEVLNTYVMAGDFSYDAIYGWGYKMGACIPDNYFADFATLPNVDLTKEYWAPSAIEDLSVGGTVYLAINDISMNKLEHAGFIFFNKKVYDDFQIEDKFGNIYQLVRDGKWTLDTFLEMVKTANRDVNGDSAITRDDVFGMLDGNGLGSDFLVTCGVSYTTKNEDGSHSLNIYSEKTLGIIEDIHAVFSSGKYVKSYEEIFNGADTTGYDDQWQYARSIFTTDHALFAGGNANATSETAFRNMESEYGIVPNPKYDEAQENYIAEISPNASIFAIPATTRQDDLATGSMERTGMILEYMSFKSNEVLLPVYYDQVLKGQRVDGDDAAMLDIVRSTTHYEFAKMYKVPQNEADITVQDTVELMFTKPATATSTYNSRKTKLQKELDEYFTDVLLLAAQGNK